MTSCLTTLVEVAYVLHIVASFFYAFQYALAGELIGYVLTVSIRPLQVSVLECYSEKNR